MIPSEWRPPPVDLLQHAVVDLQTPRLWDGRASFRKTVAGIVAKYEADGQLTGIQINKLKRILSYNNGTRTKLGLTTAVAPSPTLPSTPKRRVLRRTQQHHQHAANPVPTKEPLSMDSPQPHTPYDPLIGLGALAESLQLSSAKVHKLILSKRLPQPDEGGERLGPSWRWRNSTIEQWKTAHATEWETLRGRRHVNGEDLGLLTRIEQLEQRVTALEGHADAAEVRQT